MPDNPRGDTGNYITHIDSDYVVMAGNTPNVYPATTTDPAQHNTKNYSVNDHGGIEGHDSPIPGYTPLDNAGDFHGGNYTVVAMNAIHLDAGGGGVTMTTNGNINLTAAGGIMAITSTTEAKVQAQIVRLQSTNTVVISGPKLYVDAQEVIFNKNVKFGNNVMVNGGMAVSGELCAAHITGIKTVQQTTEENETIKGYVCPGASFVANILPDPPGTPPPPDGNVKFGMPCRFTFLVDTLQLATGAIPITQSPPHKHFYETIGTSGTTQTELYSAMKQMEGETPVQPTQTDTLGALSISSLQGQIQDDLQGKFMDFGKQIIGI